MYRDSQYPTFINVLFDNGGIGDLIAWLPSLKFIYNVHHHVHIKVWLPDFFFDFAQNTLRGTEKRITIYKLSNQLHLINRNHQTYSFKMQNYSNLGAHMTEHAFEIICHNKPDEKSHLNYLSLDLTKTNITKFNLPKNYVILTTGFTAPVREFLPEHVNNISQYVIKKGYTPVFLGKHSTNTGIKHVIEGSFSNEIDLSVGIDLIDKTTLLECVKICGEANAIVGLDNGILHLAGCTDVPIVGGFTTVNPNHRMPYRHGIMGWNYYSVVPPESLKCRFCQSNWQFTNNHDFKLCFYQDYKCLKELSAELYIEQLQKILL
jgi:ADP-heptose:LPS heptosyltransferase